MSGKPLALYWLANPLEADLVRMVLIRAGFSPINCSDLADFTQLLEQKKPNLVILDIVLPGKNGLELLKEIKDNTYQKSTPIILVSSLAFADVVVQARKAGAFDFFLKPLDADLLFKRVTQLLKNPLSADLN